MILREEEILIPGEDNKSKIDLIKVVKGERDNSGKRRKARST